MINAIRLVVSMLALAAGCSAGMAAPWDGYTLQGTAKSITRWTDYRDPRILEFSIWVYFSSQGNIFVYAAPSQGVTLSGFGRKKSEILGKGVHTESVAYESDGGFTVELNMTYPSGHIVDSTWTFKMSKPGKCKVGALDINFAGISEVHRLVSSRTKVKRCLVVEGAPFR